MGVAHTLGDDSECTDTREQSMLAKEARPRLSEQEDDWVRRPCSLDSGVRLDCVDRSILARTQSASGYVIRISHVPRNFCRGCKVVLIQGEGGCNVDVEQQPLETTSLHLKLFLRMAHSKVAHPASDTQSQVQTTPSHTPLLARALQHYSTGESGSA